MSGNLFAEIPKLQKIKFFQPLSNNLFPSRFPLFTTLRNNTTSPLITCTIYLPSTRYLTIINLPFITFLLLFALFYILIKLGSTLTIKIFFILVYLTAEGILWCTNWAILPAVRLWSLTDCIRNVVSRFKTWWRLQVLHTRRQQNPRLTTEYPRNKHSKSDVPNSWLTPSKQWQLPTLPLPVSISAPALVRVIRRSDVTLCPS